MTDPTSTRTAQVTRLLNEAGGGDRAAANDLMPLVYDELRAIAGKRMAGERAGHTLQATALVHEAYMRLIGDHAVTWENRSHFFRTAAEAMRRLLIEHARSRGRVKRGGGRRRVPMDAADLAGNIEEHDVPAIADAVERLCAQDERLGEIVRLRFFAGLSEEQTAKVIGVSDRTVRRDWVVARAWLHRDLNAARAPDEDPPSTPDP